MASITMIPSEVVTAHAEYSVWPMKYRLSKTLTGSACHVARAGGVCAGAAAGCVGVIAPRCSPGPGEVPIGGALLRDCRGAEPECKTDRRRPCDGSRPHVALR